MVISEGETECDGKSEEGERNDRRMGNKRGRYILIGKKTQSYYAGSFVREKIKHRRKFIRYTRNMTRSLVRKLKSSFDRVTGIFYARSAMSNGNPLLFSWFVLR